MSQGEESTARAGTERPRGTDPVDRPPRRFGTGDAQPNGLRCRSIPSDPGQPPLGSVSSQSDLPPVVNTSRRFSASGNVANLVVGLGAVALWPTRSVSSVETPPGAYGQRGGSGGQQSRDDRHQERRMDPVCGVASPTTGREPSTHSTPSSRCSQQSRVVIAKILPDDRLHGFSNRGGEVRSRIPRLIAGDAGTAR